MSLFCHLQVSNRSDVGFSSVSRRVLSVEWRRGARIGALLNINLNI